MNTINYNYHYLTILLYIYFEQIYLNLLWSGNLIYLSCRYFNIIVKKYLVK